MATVDDSIAAQLGNIEATYGRSIEEWVGVVSASGLSKHNEVVAVLKASHGLKHGAAHRLSRRPAGARGELERASPTGCACYQRATWTPNCSAGCALRTTPRSDNVARAWQTAGDCAQL
jgi:hypothetical protein